MGRNALTDDAADTLASDIANFVGLMFDIDMDNDTNYLPLIDYIFDKLSLYSNGYRNHN